MAVIAVNHAGTPLTGKATVPAGNAKQISWPLLESALRRAGEVRPGESVATFIVSERGLWLVLERN